MKKSATEVWKEEYKQIWNAAIEAAAEMLTELNHDGYLTDEIRKLKK